MRHFLSGKPCLCCRKGSDFTHPLRPTISGYSRKHNIDKYDIYMICKISYLEKERATQSGIAFGRRAMGAKQRTDGRGDDDSAFKIKDARAQKKWSDGPGSARREDAGNIWRNGCDGLSEFFQAESRRWGLSDVKRRLSSDGFGRNAPKAARVGDVDKNDPFRLDRRSGLKPPLLRN